MPDTILDCVDETAFRQAKTMLHHKFERILSYYFEDTESYIATILSGIETQDAGLITPAAHTIKSSSRQLGGIALAELAAEIEEMARSYVKDGADFDTLIVKTSTLQQLYNQTKKQMQSLSSQ